jgi:hypothetical protein
MRRRDKSSLRFGLVGHLAMDFGNPVCVYILPNDRCDSLFEPEGQIFDSLEWIAKVTSHIPEKGAQLVHDYGAYSNAHRGKKAKAAASALPHFAKEEESETQWVQLRRKSWAALIRLVYESDPLLCPKCGTQMKIVSVMKDVAVIDKILAHLQYKFEPLPRGHHRILPPSGISFQRIDFISCFHYGSPAPFLPRNRFAFALAYSPGPPVIPYNCCEPVGVCDGFH